MCGLHEQLPLELTVAAVIPPAPHGRGGSGFWGTGRGLKFTSVPFVSLKCENFAFGLRRKLCRGLVPPVPTALL